MQDLSVDMNCPNCGRRAKVKVKEMIPGHSKRLNCGCIVEFTGDDGREVQRSLDELGRELEKLNRTLKIKF